MMVKVPLVLVYNQYVKRDKRGYTFSTNQSAMCESWQKTGIKSSSVDHIAGTNNFAIASSLLFRCSERDARQEMDEDEDEKEEKTRRSISSLYDQSFRSNSSTAINIVSRGK